MSFFSILSIVLIGIPAVFLLIDSFGFLAFCAKKPITILLLFMGVGLVIVGAGAVLLGITAPKPVWGFVIAGIPMAASGLFLGVKSDKWGPKIASAFGGKQKKVND